jgi:hypothetical protein
MEQLGALWAQSTKGSLDAGQTDLLSKNTDLWREIVRIRREQGDQADADRGPVLVRALLTLADFEQEEAAAALVDEALELLQHTTGKGSPEVGAALVLKATRVAEREDPAREALLEEALGMLPLGDAGTGSYVSALKALAGVRHRLRKRRAAEAAYREVLDLQRWGLGRAHPEVLRTAIELAQVLHFRGPEARREARALVREVIQAEGNKVGGSKDLIATAGGALTGLLHSEKKDWETLDVLARLRDPVESGGLKALDLSVRRLGGGGLSALLSVIQAPGTLPLVSSLDLGSNDLTDG